MKVPAEIYKGVISVIVILLLPLCVFAHKLSLFAYSKEGLIYVEGYYVDGKPAQGAKLTVFDSNGEKTFSGITDDKGQLTFKVPVMDDLRLELEAGMGHKNSFVLHRGALSAHRPGDAKGSSRALPMDAIDAGKAVASQPGAMRERDRGELIEEKLKPLMDMVSEMRREMERPRLLEIVGGVGYLVGIFGLVFFFLGKREKP